MRVVARSLKIMKMRMKFHVSNVQVAAGLC